MDKQHYDEMVSALDALEKEKLLKEKRIYLFGHCNATEELVDLFLARGYYPAAILDNNKNKHGRMYKNITIEAPEEIMKDEEETTIVCIVARAYAAMSDQLKTLGYKGQIKKLVDYNSYAEYSLSDKTVVKMKARAERGIEKLAVLKNKYEGSFYFLCPFCALGDIYFMMSYLPYFMQKRHIQKCVICVVGNACAQVVHLFGKYNVEILCQKDMDDIIQASLYTQDKDIYIPHQDRPYVIDLYKALYVKRIPLEQIYCCGVFGLSVDTKPCMPRDFNDFGNLEQIEIGKSVILSPYAKSVTELKNTVWKQIIENFHKKGYQCYTNVAGDEVPLPDTIAISPKIAEIKSVVERAGTFIGIRSGLCDILRTANARKIVLHPNYNYCDTKWKSIDMYYMEGWDNRVVEDDFV